MQKMANNMLNGEEKATANYKSYYAPVSPEFYNTLLKGEIFITEITTIFPVKYIFCLNLWKSRLGSICSLETEEV